MLIPLTSSQRSTLIVELCESDAARVHVLETLFASWDAADALLAVSEARLVALVKRTGGQIEEPPLAISEHLRAAGLRV